MTNDASRIRAALALDASGAMHHGHYGDATTYLVVDVGAEGPATEVARLLNPKRGEHDHGPGEHHHGHAGKAGAIGKLLAGEGVQVLVGRGFGQNIKRMVKRFVPVVVRAEDEAAAVAALQAGFERVVAAWEAGSERSHVVLR